jgi:hypothetical protein
MSGVGLDHVKFLLWCSPPVLLVKLFLEVTYYWMILHEDGEEVGADGVT